MNHFCKQFLSSKVLRNQTFKLKWYDKFTKIIEVIGFDGYSFKTKTTTEKIIPCKQSPVDQIELVAFCQSKILVEYNKYNFASDIYHLF